MLDTILYKFDNIWWYTNRLIILIIYYGSKKRLFYKYVQIGVTLITEIQ
jgi:hypothetical protein